MKGIRKSRFLTWLMWAPAFAVCGWQFLFGWSFLQFLIYNDQVKKKQESIKFQKERQERIREERKPKALKMMEKGEKAEINNDENLTPEDKWLMKKMKELYHQKYAYKISENLYMIGNEKHSYDQFHRFLFERRYEDKWKYHEHRFLLEGNEEVKSRKLYNEYIEIEEKILDRCFIRGCVTLKELSQITGIEEDKIEEIINNFKDVFDWRYTFKVPNEKQIKHYYIEKGKENERIIFIREDIKYSYA